MRQRKMPIKSVGWIFHLIPQVLPTIITYKPRFIKKSIIFTIYPNEGAAALLKISVTYCTV